MAHLYLGHEQIDSEFDDETLEKEFELFVMQAQTSPNGIEFALEVEASVLSLFENPSQATTPFDNLCRTKRYVVHQIAQYFRLRKVSLSTSSSAASTILVEKTADSRVPEKRVVDVLNYLREQQKKEKIETPKMIIARPKKNVSQGTVDQPVVNAESSSNDAAAAVQQPDAISPVVEEGEADRAKSQAYSSLKEREEAYEAARNRILGPQKSEIDKLGCQVDSDEDLSNSVDFISPPNVPFPGPSPYETGSLPVPGYLSPGAFALLTPADDGGRSRQQKPPIFPYPFFDGQYAAGFHDQPLETIPRELPLGPLPDTVVEPKLQKERSKARSNFSLESAEQQQSGVLPPQPDFYPMFPSGAEHFYPPVLPASSMFSPQPDMRSFVPPDAQPLYSGGHHHYYHQSTNKSNYQHQQRPNSGFSSGKRRDFSYTDSSFDGDPMSQHQDRTSSYRNDYSPPSNYRQQYEHGPHLQSYHYGHDYNSYYQQQQQQQHYQQQHQHQHQYQHQLQQGTTDRGGQRSSRGQCSRSPRFQQSQSAWNDVSYDRSRGKNVDSYLPSTETSRSIPVAEKYDGARQSITPSPQYRSVSARTTHDGGQQYQKGAREHKDHLQGQPRQKSELAEQPNTAAAAAAAGSSFPTRDKQRNSKVGLPSGQRVPTDEDFPPLLQKPSNKAKQSQP